MASKWKARAFVASALVSLIPSAGIAQLYEDQWVDDGGERRGLSLARHTGAVPATHTVHRGDTLWSITHRYFGNPYEWPRIWSYNPEISNPHWIYPLDQVRLGDGSTPAEAAATPGARGTALSEGGVYLREQGYLDADALETAGVVVGSPTDHMLLMPYDEVYVRFDELENGQEPGGEFTIFRRLESREREPGEQGTLVRILGTILIDRYDRDQRLASGRLVEALEPIERGFQVAAIPRRFDVVNPVPASQDLESEVVATLLPTQLVGDQQIVFAPVGSEDGVVRGNRFFVTRADDGWRRTLQTDAIGMGATTQLPRRPNDWPVEVVAEARAVVVRPNSVGLLITRATEVIEVGDHIELRRGY